MLVVISFLILSLTSFPGYFTVSLALHPGFSGPWRPPPALSSTLTTFHLLRVLRFWVDIFYPQAFFTLRSFPTFLPQAAFIKASLGAGSSSMKFEGLHTDPQNPDPAHLFVWFTVIANPLYILNLYLYMSILQKVLLVVKTLIKNIIFLIQFLIE